MSLFNDPSLLDGLQTPSFIYNLNEILRSTALTKKIKAQTGFKILFPLKSFCLRDALLFIGSENDGFSASSLFEARLARQVAGEKGVVHLTTPSLKVREITEISELCDFISFNSWPQFERLASLVGPNTSCGLRVNPQRSFIKDRRFDPCRRHSKLGMPISQLHSLLSSGVASTKCLQGIHFHSNCESVDFGNLLETVQLIVTQAHSLMNDVIWINLGGGYLLDDLSTVGRLAEEISLLKERYSLEFFFEPGKAIIGKAGYVVSSVLDLFESDGKSIAILDSSVNHMPEVFEYQYKPDVAQESEDGEYSYILAGATCLAGDVFGEYCFDEPLEIGSRIVFEDMGAYTLVKANMFNGINLPTIYAYTLDGKLEMKRQFTYEDFLSRCGANGNVPS